MNIFLTVPKNGKILVKAGQMIDFQTKLFEIFNPKIVKVDLAKKLGISPQNIFSYLKKFIGEKVKKGEILASKKGILKTKKVKSEWDGVLKEINHEEGSLLIEIETDEEQKGIIFFSPIIGEVEKIEEEKIIIKIEKKEEIELKEKTKEIFGAKIYIFEKGSDFNAESAQNRLVIAEELTSISQTKAEALGAKGFLTIKTPPENTTLPIFQFKNLSDIKKIKKNWYCFVDKNSSKIIFYE
mgnify:CR=1 FL=1